MKRVVAIMALLAVLVVVAVALLRFFPRPADTTDPQLFAGDGAALDYCVEEDSSSAGAGLTADDIPTAYTPGCGWATFPQPILAGCMEPLPAGAPDLRGLWRAVEGRVGHIERIEQCGNRVVITSSGIIHDMRADGTLQNGVNDVAASNCMRIFVAAEFNNGSLDLRPFDAPPVLVKRYLEGEEMVWEYAGVVSRLERICSFSE